MRARPGGDQLDPSVGPPSVRASTLPRRVPEPTTPRDRSRWMSGAGAPADGIRRPPTPEGGNREMDSARLRRRQITHDIHHGLGTVSLLAALMSTAPDVGPDSRARAALILKELSWLDQLQQAYEECMPAPVETGWRGRERIRLDLVAAEVVEAMGLSCTTRVELRAEELTVYVEPLAFWRVLRNVVHNAVRAAGPSGTVVVRLASEGGWAVTQVDDDGPGFGAAPPRAGALGLGIVQDLTIECGGSLEIRRSALGGGCIRLRLPSAPSREQGLVA